jgi:hypothetical protein
MINCSICNAEMSVLTGTHLKKHAMTMAEYKLKFPDAPLVDEAQRERASLHAKANNRPGVARPGVGVKIAKTKAERKAKGVDYGAKTRGISKSDEAKANISAAVIESYKNGRVHWNQGNEWSDEHKKKLARLSKLYKLTNAQVEAQLAAMARHISAAKFTPPFQDKRHSEESKLKIASSLEKVKDVTRAKMEAKGRWLLLNQVNEFEKYKRAVWRHTKKVESQIPGYDASKRGLCKRGSDNHQVDHIMSITDGFKQSIAPQLIGSLANLQFIPWLDNLVKHSTSGISPEELIALLELPVYI